MVACLLDSQEILQFLQTINFEFISANPTGYLHIGHARNAIIGDVLVNVLERLNKKVTREYYIKNNRKL